MFAQSCILLTSRPLTLDDLQPALRPFQVIGRTEAQKDAHWAIGAPAWVLAVPGMPRGRVIVDAIGERWPDQMGRPDDPILTRAWAMGGFGPGVETGALERAGTQAWAWRKAGDAVRGHQGFVRIRLAYAPEEGAGPVPEPRDRMAELMAVTKVAAKLLEVDGVRCYFNPNGESLRPAGFVWQAMDYYESEKEPPLDVWTNVRVGKLDPEGKWVLMDSVGLGQLGLPDVEMCLPNGQTKLEDADRFTRDLMAYLVDAGDVIKADDTIEGPGEVDWTALRVIEGFSPPTRETVRFLPPVDGIPAHLKMSGSRAAAMAQDLGAHLAAHLGPGGVNVPHTAGEGDGDGDGEG